MAEPDPNELSLSVAMPDGGTRRAAPGKGEYPFLGPRLAPGELGRFDDYRVLRLLGSGGMGLVFAAEELSLRRLQEDNQELVARWMQQKLRDADVLNAENESERRKKQEKIRAELEVAASEPFEITPHPR